MASPAASYQNTKINIRRNMNNLMDYDDTHFCLKCNATIVGLDNYISHRKTGCGKQVPSKSPLPSQLLPPHEIGLKADDFFSSLELCSSTKKPLQSTSGKTFSGILTRSKTTSIQATQEPQSKSGKNVWIGDNLGQAKPIHTVNHLTYDESDSESEDFDYESESSDDNAPPRNYTGGKWKPSSPVPEDWNIPPPSYTGGKWATGGKYPPPGHTKGKWKPVEPNLMLTSPGHGKGKGKGKGEQEEEIIPPTPKGKSIGKARLMEDDVPPPNYTKGSEWYLQIVVSGKWKPVKHDEDAGGKGSGKSGKGVKLKLIRKPNQYWCSTCNRKLASKVVYERHLKSVLHLKKKSIENDLDDEGPQTIIKPKPEYTVVEEKKRKRRKIYETCLVCKSRVNKYLIGKHLVSHYHLKKGDVDTDVAKQMVLDNILSVVLESPFECTVCKFYCNTHEQFMAHWSSDLHAQNDKKHPGHYVCQYCKHKSDNSGQLHLHLKSQEHLEVVSIINASVPIVIKKVTETVCLTCEARFTLNIQLLNHCRKLGHDSRNISVHKAHDYKCGSCDKSFSKPLSLQHHARKHKVQFFFCGMCDLRFDTRIDAKRHKMSKDHKDALAKKANPERFLQKKKCDSCDGLFDNYALLKEHVAGVHPEHKMRCPYCGLVFIIHQELSNHLKSRRCTFPQGSPDDAPYRCDKCAYSSTSSSELMFHSALHGEPLDDKKPKYKCPVCDKFFPTSSLLPHLRQHTKERPYSCRTCKATFTRKNNLIYHEKNHDRRRVNKRSVQGKEFLCSTCGAAFAKRFTLEQHMLIHTGKVCRCPQVGCFFNARNLRDLEEHFKTHSSERNFACDLCGYKGKTKKQLNRHMVKHEEKKFSCSSCLFTCRTSAHLKRHQRLHTGVKPFQCPYCTFKCENMDYLRRHIVKTTKHPGRCLYECKLCYKFRSNEAKTFKNHLMLLHREQFASTTEAASYVAVFHQVEDDLEHEINEPPTLDQMLPMFIIPKDDGVAEAWNIGRYDVEESGTLVPFQSGDEDELFQDF